MVRQRMIGLLSFSGAIAVLASSCERSTPESLMAINVEANDCEWGRPLSVKLTNNTGEKIDGVTFSVTGKNRGHSKALAYSGAISTDRIMEDGETYSFCVSEPMRVAYGPAPEAIIWEYEASVERVWRGQLR